ncbi:MAG: hypothetical protein H8D46_00130, partial [FCB group bacterium]|nr:hypothetical protein [FCB group bacterium]
MLIIRSYSGFLKRMAAAVLFLFTRYRQLLFIHLLLPGVLLAGVGFQPQRTYFEADIGFHMPQAVYDKYADSGLSFRFVYSFVDPHLSFIHYDLGAQFLAFRSESWMESSYLFGPLVDVNNSEQCLGLTFGPRITSPSFQGALRPYIGVKGGMFFFYETITWELEEGPGFWCWIFDT